MATNLSRSLIKSEARSSANKARSVKYLGAESNPFSRAEDMKGFTQIDNFNWNPHTSIRFHSHRKMVHVTKASVSRRKNPSDANQSHLHGWMRERPHVTQRVWWRKCATQRTTKFTPMRLVGRVIYWKQSGGAAQGVALPIFWSPAFLGDYSCVHFSLFVCAPGVIESSLRVSNERAFNLISAPPVSHFQEID